MSRILSALFWLALGAALGAGGLWFAHHGRDGAPEAKAAAPAAAAGADAAAPDSARPAFLVVLGEVYDREAFMSGYTAKLPPIYAQHGGVYLAAGRNFEVFEGEAGFKSYVISKWPSMDAVRAFWTSPEYDELRRARIDGNWGRFDVFAIEGLPAPSTSAAAASPPPK